MQLFLRERSYLNVKTIMSSGELRKKSSPQDANWEPISKYIVRITLVQRCAWNFQSNSVSERLNELSWEFPKRDELTTWDAEPSAEMWRCQRFSQKIEIKSADLTSCGEASDIQRELKWSPDGLRLLIIGGYKQFWRENSDVELEDSKCISPQKVWDDNCSEDGKLEDFLLIGSRWKQMSNLEGNLGASMLFLNEWFCTETLIPIESIQHHTEDAFLSMKQISKGTGKTQKKCSFYIFLPRTQN